jgi:hypothetical protein
MIHVITFLIIKWPVWRNFVNQIDERNRFPHQIYIIVFIKLHVYNSYLLLFDIERHWLIISNTGKFFYFNNNVSNLYNNSVVEKIYGMAFNPTTTLKLIYSIKIYTGHMPCINLNCNLPAPEINYICKFDWTCEIFKKFKILHTTLKLIYISPIDCAFQKKCQVFYIPINLIYFANWYIKI